MSELDFSMVTYNFSKEIDETIIELLKSTNECQISRSDEYVTPSPIRSYDVKVKITGHSKGIADHYVDINELVEE